MNKTEYVASIDFGTTKIVVAIGKIDENSKVEIIGHGRVPFLGAKLGVNLNTEEALRSIKAAINEASDISGVNIDNVNIGVSGRPLDNIKINSHIDITSNDGIITTNDLTNLFVKVNKIALEPGAEIIKVVPISYTIDNETDIFDPIGRTGKRLEGLYNITKAQTPFFNSYIKIVNSLGISVNKIVLNSLASSDAVLTHEEKEAGIVLVDIGGGTTDIALFLNGIVHHAAVIPFGGNVITNDIKIACSILARQAEILKVKFGSALSDMAPEDRIVTIPGISGRDPKEISFKSLAYIIQSRMEEIIDAVNYEIENSGYAEKLSAGLVLTGGGALLKHLSQLVKFKTGLDVRIGFPKEHLSPKSYDKNNQPNFSSIIGLLISRDSVLDLKIKEALLFHKYQEARNLINTNNVALENNELLLKEFDFIFSRENSLIQELKKWNESAEYYNFITNLWALLGKNNFQLILNNQESKFVEITSTKEIESNHNNNNHQIKNTNIESSYKKGDSLERSMLELFEYLFHFDEANGISNILKLRKQSAGNQFGFDIEFECQIKDNEGLTCKVECKNLSPTKKTHIDLKDIADKLIQLEYGNSKYDFWILISPYLDPSNELNEHLKEFAERNSINIQVWCPQTFIDEFFGLKPEIYKKFNFPKNNSLPHPDEWSQSIKNSIVEKWRNKLIPPIKLPEKWRYYYSDPSNFLLNNELSKSIEFNDLYLNHIERYCNEDNGLFVNEPLNGVIQKWLDIPISDEPTLFLLGDFGDGKSTYTYILARKLFEKFKSNPKSGWIPIRFSLKDFGFDGINSSSDFLTRSLNQLNASLGDWNELIIKYHSRILIILDGFDEISKNLDHDSIFNNFNKLINCYNDYFSNSKVLITSRKHFLNIHSNKNRLLSRIGNPKLIHLLPFDKSRVIEHLYDRLETQLERDKLNKLRRFHDPIGLATKPLFLEMVKGTIKDLPEQDLDELILYKTYINKCLARKNEQLDRNEIEVTNSQINKNLIEVLTWTALELHKQQSEYIFLSDYSYLSNAKNRVKYAEQLWEICNTELKIEEDAASRIAYRSLLTKVKVKETQDNISQRWPVDFSHRSLREYFVAKGVVDMLQYDISKSVDYLKKVTLGFEIVFFASLIMKESKIDFTNTLIFLINATSCKHNDSDYKKFAKLGSNAMNLLFKHRGMIPGLEWNNLVLDGANLNAADLSNKNFSFTSLKYANLDNAIFNGANFSNANLKGVKIEETSDILSIAPSLCGEKLYVLYDDLTIKEWLLSFKEKAHPVTIARIESDQIGKLLVINNNKLLIYNKNKILYFSLNEKSTFNYSSFIDCDPYIEPYKVKKEFALLINKNRNICLVNLKNRIIIKEQSYNPSNIYEHISNKFFIEYNQKRGVIINDIESNDNHYLNNSDQITSISSYESKHNNHYIAIGDQNGQLDVFLIQKNNTKLGIEKVHSEKYNNSIIKDIIFINPNTIIISLSDKKICHLEFKKGKLASVNKQFYFLKIQCVDMIIDNLKEENEYKKLMEFINS